MSRSVVLKNCNPSKRLKFRITGEAIPSLGKLFDKTLKDTTNVKNIGDQMTHWLRKINKSELLGKFKSWCYQHGVLPRIPEPLMMYDVPMVAVKKWKAK